MTEIRFYHLQKSSLDQALPQILEKALSAGHRVHVRVPLDEDAKRLDAALWTYRDNSFLPHGMALDKAAKDHPIVISTTPDNVNDATMIVLTQGCVEESLDAYTLCCEMLNGGVAEQITAARQRWKIYKDKDYAVTYWAQDEQGRWAKKA